MLIYANQVRFGRAPGVEGILGVAARWLSRKSQESISPGLLRESRSMRLRDASQLQTWIEDSESPQLLALRLTHGDRDVPGRQWITELGVQDLGTGSPVEASIVLATSEISARVTSPIQVTRPLLVENLLNECAPVGDTPGLRVKSLTSDSARAFRYLVTDERRASPLVVVSPTPAGTYLVDCDRLRSLLVGLADVVQIPADADTFSLADTLGKEHVAWHGAINVLFIPRTRGGERFVPRTRLLADALNEIRDEGLSVESELLSIVCHRTNLAIARRHITPDSVREAGLRRELVRRRRQAEEAGSTAELLPLYEKAEEESRRKIAALEEKNLDLEVRLEDMDEDNRTLGYQIEGLKAQLAATGSRPGIDDNTDCIARAREAVLAAIEGAPTPEQSLQVIQALYPDRLIILDSAWRSSRDSLGFAYRAKAFDLLRNLAGPYWDLLAGGKGDHEARKVFGNAYAPHESETVEKNKRARALRTFIHEGTPIEMMSHLKIGVKPSAAETLRIHFEWVGKLKKIIIGHCGPHLDHG